MSNFTLKRSGRKYGIHGGPGDPLLKSSQKLVYLRFTCLKEVSCRKMTWKCYRHRTYPNSRLLDFYSFCSRDKSSTKSGSWHQWPVQSYVSRSGDTSTCLRDGGSHSQISHTRLLCLPRVVVRFPARTVETGSGVTTTSPWLRDAEHDDVPHGH